MKININLKTTLKDSIKDSRTSVYIWKSLDQLKEFYADVVDPHTINSIAEKIVTGEYLINNRKYKKRSGLEEVFNESCLCNLVEMELLNRPEVLDTFLNKPINIKKNH